MSKILDQILQSPNVNLQEYNLKDQIGEDFWHTVIKVNGEALSGGHSVDKNHARAVAVAEYLERNEFFKISQSDSLTKKIWGLDIIPTGCGFAAGFNKRNTVIRSIGEALERWALSMWIDEKYSFPEHDSNKILSTLDKPSQWYKNQFDSVRFFGKDFLVEIDGDYLMLNVVVTVCFKDSGVYMGSAVGLNRNILWTHALVESYRHLRIANTSKSADYRFPFNRILFFSKNADIAIKTIENSTKEIWKKPSLIFNYCTEYENGNYYLSRSIFDGWQSWHLGNEERFLY